MATGFRRVGRVDVRAVSAYGACGLGIIALAAVPEAHPLLIALGACLAMVVVALVGLALHQGTGPAAQPGRAVVDVTFEGRPATLLRETPSIQATTAAFLVSPAVGLLAGAVAAYVDGLHVHSAFLGAGAGAAGLVPAVAHLVHGSVRGVMLTDTELVVHDVDGEQRLRWADVQKVQRCEKHVHVRTWRPDQFVAIDLQEARLHGVQELVITAPVGGLTTTGLMRLLTAAIGHPVDGTPDRVVTTTRPVDPAAAAVFGTPTGVDAVYRLTFAGALMIPVVVYIRPDDLGDPRRAELIELRAVLLRRRLLEGSDFVIDGFDAEVTGEPVRLQDRGELLEITVPEGGDHRVLAQVATVAEAQQVLLDRLDPDDR